MTTPIAVAIVHGMGNGMDVDSKHDIIDAIKQRFCKQLDYYTDGNSSEQLFIEFVDWASIFKGRENKMFKDVVESHKLRYQSLRSFVIHYVGDVIAYQPVREGEGKENYKKVHEKFQKTLRVLAEKAGDAAPLCVISHSLGSVVASDYFYDIERRVPNAPEQFGDWTTMEKGETLALFYTLGTTLPLWSLRYEEFDAPINIPSKKLQDYYKGLDGEWLNFYDKDDVLAYPLRPVSKAYETAVKEDRAVNIGGLLEFWNPLSHTRYLTDKDVIEPIVNGLVKAWCHINHINVQA